MNIYVEHPVVSSDGPIKATLTRQSAKGHQHYVLALTYKAYLLHTEVVEFMDGAQQAEFSIGAEEVGLMNGGIVSINLYDSRKVESKRNKEDEYFYF